MRGFIFFFFIVVSVQAQTNTQAYNYLNFINDNHKDVVAQTWNYMYTYTHEKDYYKRKGQLKKLENVLNRSLRYIKKKKAYDKELKQAAIIYLEGNLAIVNKDYTTLIKIAQQKGEPTTNKREIKRRIRKAMYTLRANYDNFVNSYAEKYNIEVVPNNSALSQQMEHAINVYDYYYSMQELYDDIIDLERHLWRDFNNSTSANFSSTLNELMGQVTVSNKKLQLVPLPSDNTILKEALQTLQSKFIEEYTGHTMAAITYLNKKESGDKKGLSAIVDSFNKEKTWFNINRREIHDSWIKTSQDYLRQEIQPLH